MKGTTEKKVKTENIFSTDIYTLDIHDLANMNPMQNAEDFLATKHSIAVIGQQDPIVLFKGRVADGRNRLKALKELYEETKDEKYKIVMFRKLPTTLSIGELEEIIIGKETRRHQSPVQKAVSALNYYTAKSKQGEVISMREAAKKFGVGVSSVSKILSLRTQAGEAVVQKLFNGEGIMITASKRDGTVYTKESFSPDAIRKYYFDLAYGNKGSSYVDSVAAEEMAYAQLVVTKLVTDMSYDGLKYLVTMIENSKDLNKTSYDVEVINSALGLKGTKDED